MKIDKLEPVVAVPSLPSMVRSRSKVSLGWLALRRDYGASTAATHFAAPDSYTSTGWGCFQKANAKPAR